MPEHQAYEQSHRPQFPPNPSNAAIQQYDFRNITAEDEEISLVREGPSIIAFLMEGHPDAEKRLDLYLLTLVTAYKQIESGKIQAQYYSDDILQRLEGMYYFYYQSEILVLQVLQRRKVQDQDVAQSQATAREHAAVSGAIYGVVVVKIYGNEEFYFFINKKKK